MNIVRSEEVHLESCKEALIQAIDGDVELSDGCGMVKLARILIVAGKRER